MTVAELIATLQTMDQNAIVRVLNLHNGEYTPDIDVEFDPYICNGSTSVDLVPSLEQINAAMTSSPR